MVSSWNFLKSTEKMDLEILCKLGERCAVLDLGLRGDCITYWEVDIVKTEDKAQSESVKLSTNMFDAHTCLHHMSRIQT